jgi:hypothetical protein
MDMMGWTALTLSERVGVSHGFMKCILSGHKESLRVQRAIEDALKIALWSSRNEFLARNPECRIEGVES